MLETIEFLADMLPQLSSEGIRLITIMTGSGCHATGGKLGKTRIRPAVERFLQSHGYHYNKIMDQCYLS